LIVTPPATRRKRVLIAAGSRFQWRPVNAPSSASSMARRARHANHLIFSKAAKFVAWDSSGFGGLREDQALSRDSRRHYAKPPPGELAAFGRIKRLAHPVRTEAKPGLGGLRGALPHIFVSAARHTSEPTSSPVID
jgi:hypothetical protein